MENIELVTRFLGAMGIDAWVLQVFVVVFVTLALDFVQRRILRRLRTRLEKTATLWDEAVLVSLHRPMSLLIWVVGISFAANIITRVTGAAIFEATDPIRDVGVIAAITWFLVGLVRQVESGLIAQREAKGEAYDRTTVDALGKLVRLSVIITAMLVALQTLGFSVSGVLAFGGIGGIALGFAASMQIAVDERKGR